MPVVEWVREAVTANWHMKLTSLVLAAALWALVAVEEPTTQLMAVPVTVQAPEGRSLTGGVPDVEVLFAGSARELLKLFATPATIHRSIPEGWADSLYTLQLTPADVDIPKHVTARVQEVRPRSVVISLATADLPPVARIDSAGQSERVLMGVPVIVRDEAGGSWSSDPLAVMVTVHGPNSRVAYLTRDSVSVIAVPTTGQTETVALQIIARDSIETWVTPDSAVIRRRIRG